MKITINLCLCVISLLASELADAAIYKCVAPNGQLSYSNVMGEGCVKLELEWEKIGESSSDELTIYYDPDTIRKNGDRVKMWSLLDFKAAQEQLSGKPYLSEKSQYQYDCKEEQFRRLAYTYHSGNMGSGEVVNSSSDSGKWEPVPPRSVAEALWNKACETQ